MTDEDIEQGLQYSLMVIVCIIAIVICLGLIDSRKLRPNELFQWSSIVVFLFYISDFISDIFFSGKLLLQAEKEEYYLALFIASVFFVLLPVVANVYQLHDEISKWNEERMSSPGNSALRHVARWVESRVKTLYMLSFVSGSSFSSVILLNSYLFRLDLFSMGLSKKQLAAFHTKRIFSVVLLEVKLWNVAVCLYVF